MSLKWVKCSPKKKWEAPWFIIALLLRKAKKRAEKKRRHSTSKWIQNYEAFHPRSRSEQNPSTTDLKLCCREFRPIWAKQIKNWILIRLYQPTQARRRLNYQIQWGWVKTLWSRNWFTLLTSALLLDLLIHPPRHMRISLKAHEALAARKRAVVHISASSIKNRKISSHLIRLPKGQIWSVRNLWVNKKHRRQNLQLLMK